VRFLEQLSNAINHWIEYLLFGLGISMALIVATQVFFRYVLNQSLFWSEELARFLLVWLTFLGATVAYRRKAHPGIDVLYSRMPPELQKTAVILTHLAAITLFSVAV
jgi:TRAP-type C4-dicarboxylate transport system permease small subunit